MTTTALVIRCPIPVEERENSVAAIEWLHGIWRIDWSPVDRAIYWHRIAARSPRMCPILQH